MQIKKVTAEQMQIKAVKCLIRAYNDNVHGYEVYKQVIDGILWAIAKSPMGHFVAINDSGKKILAFRLPSPFDCEKGYHEKDFYLVIKRKQRSFAYTTLTEMLTEESTLPTMVDRCEETHETYLE